MTDTTTVVQESYFPKVFIIRFIEGIVGIIEILFAFRLALKFFDANPASQFVSWIYQITSSFLGPFAGAFPSESIGGGSVVDVVAILAMIAYAVFGWIVIKLLLFIFNSAVKV